MNFGFLEVVRWFLYDKISRNYCFKRELERHPELKWRIRFLHGVFIDPIFLISQMLLEHLEIYTNGDFFHLTQIA
jgi:hypothetical protein